jgi:copper chaperone CopZ
MSVEAFMVDDVGHDYLALIRIEGMHCHKCELAIQRALTSLEGVHEVEVDFNSRQASVLFAKGAVTPKQFMDAITQAGYRPTGLTQRDTQITSKK